MKQETINKIIKHLSAIKDAEITIDQYQQFNNLSSQFIYNKIKSIKAAHTMGNIDDKTYNNIINLYNSVKANSAKSKDVEESDNVSEITIDRDENGRITKYNFLIYIRDKPSLIGSFSRDEMSLIYRLYSSYGSNITQREVSRFFPEYSLCDFKRILRTFNITKASSPFPPHIIEEHTKEELLDMQFREKENDFLRSYEAEKIRFLDVQLKKYMKENADLKDQLNSFGELLSDIDLSKIDVKFTPSNIKDKKDIIIWLSDMHIGAYTTEYSLFDNSYDETIVKDRLNKVFIKVYEESLLLGGFDNVIVCNLGDSLDGYNGKTNRGTELSQNMNNKDQIKTFISSMTEFLSKLVKHIPCNNIKYYAVGESNHGSDFEYAANVSLSYICTSINIEATIFSKSIDYFVLENVTYIVTHGNDNKNMNRGLPLTINDKAENYINDYLTYNNISGKVVFVKGDLHQSAVTYAKRFVYKSVGSLYGSSDWIQANFGFTKACCDYSIVNKNGDRLDGLVILN